MEIQVEEPPPQAPSPTTRILMGVNQSSLKGYPHPSISSRNAFQWTLNKIVRSNVRDFTFLFLHVLVPDDDAFDDLDSVYASPDDFKRLKDRDMTKGIHLLKYFVESCHQIGLNCEAWIKKGDPSEVICSEVKRVQPDILVVGNRGLGPFQRFFVGTISEFCLKNADCPVVTIKRSPEETPEDVIED